MFQSFVTKAGDISERLQKENPEFVSKNVQSLGTEVEKLNVSLKAEGAVVSEKVQDLLKVILDKSVEAAGHITTQLNTAVKDASAAAAAAATAKN